MEKTIVVAGATGNLGKRIVNALRGHKVKVVALVRKGADDDKVKSLQDLGSEVKLVDTSNIEDLTQAIWGADCVISALQGLHDVIIDTQSNLLEAAVKAGVPRFIPSDFCTDFRKQPEGENRNFDLRREFHKRLDGANVAATSIFNGAFTTILTYNVPLFDAKKKVVGYWDDPDWHIDFTSMDDTAAYTAAAAADTRTPKALHIASFQVSPRELQKFTAEVLGTPFELVSLGTRKQLAESNKRERAAHPEGENDLYASWQQTQYLQSMFSTHHESLDNERYSNLAWTTLQEILKPKS